ncbi:MAG TPA: hypothetical protein VJS42_13430 [Steroidobacteraceae bacterium]|nr:hypothetical protein [Steroidobacteraceae bacterium]
MSRFKLASAAVLSALALAACSNNDGPGKTPRLTAVANQSIPQDTSTDPLVFQVRDDDGAEKVTVAATSSDAALIPNENILLSGTGVDRTVQLTPAEEATGTATITLVATDATGRTTSRTFTVQVNVVPVSFLARSKEVYAQDENEQPQSLLGFTFTLDADDDPMAFDDVVGPESP